MAYTSAQLVAAYTAANAGIAPDAATTALLAAFATQTQTGQLSDAAALAYVINSADNDVSVAVQAYQFFTGKTPTQAGLAYLVNSTTNTNDLNDPYYAQFGLENRYINFAANLGVVGEGAAAFASTYGSMSFAQFVGVAYETIIGSSYAQAAGINVSAAIADVTSRQANFTAIARQAGIINSTSTTAQVDIATKAALIGYLMAEGIKADVGVYAAGANQFVASLVNGNPQYNVNLITTYSVLGGGVGNPVGTGGTPGASFALTTAADVLGPLSGTAALKTTAGDDKIFGLTNDSLNSGDVIDGGLGSDSITANIATAGTIAPVLTSIESVTLNSVSAGGAAIVLDMKNSTGTDQVWLSGQTAGAADTLTAQSLAAGVQAGIRDNGGTKANVYNFQYVDSAASGANDAVTLNLVNNNNQAIPAGGGTGAVTIRNTTSTTGTNGFETVNITTSGGTSILASLASTQGGGGTALKTVNVSGSSSLTITGSLAFNGGVSGTINSTTSAGTLTLTATGGEAITFTQAGAGSATITTGAGNDILTGGAGNDTFTIGTGNDTVVGGAGNDAVRLGALADLTAADSISLGDGARDTLSIVAGTTAINTTTITADIKTLINNTGAEVIELRAAGVTGVDYSAITQDIVRITTASAAANVVATNVATGDILIFNADQTGVTGGSAIQASGVLPNQTFKIELAGSGIDISNVVTAATDSAIELSSNITTLQIDSNNTPSPATTVNTIGGALNAGAFAIKNTSAQTVVITGNSDLDIRNTTSAATINNGTFSNGVDVQASAFTGKLTIGGSAQADIITGGAGNDIISAGGGNDTINLAAGGSDKFNFYTHAGNGTDTINGFNGAAGNDTLNVGTLGSGAITGPATVITSAATQQALTDTLAYLITTTGAAANLTTGGTAAVTDWTNLTQVGAYLSERFTATAGASDNVFVVNTGNTSYVYSFVDAAGTTLVAGELALVGVVNNGGTALTASSIVFA
jgi:S-layer protein